MHPRSLTRVALHYFLRPCSLARSTRRLVLRAAWSALHFAAATGSTQLVRKLILFGANINIKNGQGKTPLRLAAEAGKRSVCAYLIKKGANVNLAGEM